MNKRNWKKVLGILIVLCLLTGNLFWMLSADREEPENPLRKHADPMHVELMDAGGHEEDSGDSSGKGMDSEEVQERQEKERQEAPEQKLQEEEPKETEPKKTDHQGNPVQDSQTGNDSDTSGDTTGNGKVTDGEGELPSDGGDQDTEQPGEGDIPGETEDGLITDLYSHTVTVPELTDDTLRFYVYYSDPQVDAHIRVNYRHKSDSGNGSWLSGSGKNYETKLKLGLNYITIYYSDAEGKSHEARYVITYEAEKADTSTPEIGEHPPIIETGLDDWSGPIKTTEFTLTVQARTWKLEPIYSNQIEVRMDGKRITNPTGDGKTKYEYILYFTPPAEGDSEWHTVSVLAWDEEGNSRCVTYRVEYESHDDGEQIGVVTIIVDATSVGLGILDTDVQPLIQGEAASCSVVRMLEELGYEVEYGGSLSNGFYLRRISRADAFRGAKMDDRLTELVERDGIGFTSPCTRDSLGEHDFTRGSGWNYAVNDYYPGKGMAEWKLNDGDVLHLRYTVAYGKDIGISFSEQGSLTNYCGLWINETFTPLSHDYKETFRKEATAAESGYVEYTCSKCKETKCEEIPATGGTDPPVVPEEPENPEPPDNPEQPENPEQPPTDPEKPEAPLEPENPKEPEKTEDDNNPEEEEGT